MAILVREQERRLPTDAYTTSAKLFSIRRK